MKTSVIITALICVTVLELYALYRGINGTLLTLVVGAICSIVALMFETPKFLKGGK